MNKYIIGIAVGLMIGISTAQAEPLDRITNHREPIVVTTMMQFSPEHTVCRSFRLPKWNLVYHSYKHKIPKGSKIRWFQTLTCRDFSQNPINEFYMQQEWWRKK